MPDQFTVPVFAPDGQMRSIPQDQIQAALSNGGQRAALMTDPTGTHRYVPEGMVNDAVRNGGRLYTPTTDELMPKWYGFTLNHLLSQGWSGFTGAVSGAVHLAADTAKAGLGVQQGDATAVIPLAQKYITEPYKSELQKAHEYEGRSSPSTSAALGHRLAAVTPLVGPWAAGLGEQAGTGDIGGAAAQVAGAIGAGKAMQAATTKLPAKLNEVVPSTTRAGRGINILEQRFGEHPIEPLTAMQTVTRFERELEPTPSVNLPPIIRDFQGRMAEATLPGHGLTFMEARQFLKRANEQIGGETGIKQNALKSFAKAISDDIHTGVAQPSEIAPEGFAADYQRMTNEFRRGSKIIRAGEEIGPVVGAGIGYEVGRKAGQPVGGVMLGGMAGRLAGKETIGRATRAVIERQGGTPRLNTPRTPEEYTRTILAAKEGNIPAGEADRLITRGGGRVGIIRRPQEPSQ